ncbi:hypothetical protein FVE85_8674 [Porphyridium purpureum]|uniref:FUN14 domain-containing protein 1 n=1 Tax=Porphyridium purpureum TaxID=35688 RepID=A0A5J4YP66_PORPP|nr:hypothetical protein FVE85_8674 [Porphyridium purpureum]|eukprot:POR4827..scf296_7
MLLVLNRNFRAERHCGSYLAEYEQTAKNDRVEIKLEGRVFRRSSGCLLGAVRWRILRSSTEEQGVDKCTMSEVRSQRVAGRAATDVHGGEFQSEYELFPSSFDHVEGAGFGTARPRAQALKSPQAHVADSWLHDSDKRESFSGFLRDFADGSFAVDTKEPPHGQNYAAADHGVIPSAFNIENLPASPVGKQAWMGMMLGYAAGFSVRRIGRILLGMAGTEIVLLQYMAYRGWVRVDWNAIMSDLMPIVDYHSFDRVIEVLKHRVPFAASFSAGLFTGLKYDLF